ncbi:MAG: MBL fold metallo-hydrolase [Lachnospiraceae bacterium]|nr:MBL fold metallo-hydrolase [Lachnospiraceae bacterium]
MEGHSCFKLEKDGYTIITDPYADGSVPGYAPICEKADMVLCSHEHADHNFRDGVELIERQGLPFHVEVIETYHDEVCGKKRGPNKIFIIDDGENRVAHFGDLGCELTPEQMEKLQNLDVAMLPVGGYFTIDARQAADIVLSLKPGIVIPMHYRSVKYSFGYDVIGTVDEFTEAMESRALAGRHPALRTGYSMQNRLTAMARPASMIRSANHGHIMDNVKTLSGSELEIGSTNASGPQVTVLQPRNIAI